MRLGALVRRSFARARGLLLTLAGVLVLFEILVVIAAVYLHERGAFTQIIAFLPFMAQQMLGGVFSSFAGMVAFGYFHPVVVIVFVGMAIAVASEPAADVESGVVDLVLSRPIGRWQVVTRTILVLAGTIIGLASLMVTATRLGMWWFVPAGGPALPLRSLVKLAANLVAVAWVFGALSLAIASVGRRRGLATGAAGLVALALYLLDVLAGLLPRIKPYGVLSPFHYYQPISIVSGLGTQWSADVLLLTIAGVALCGIAYFCFWRRDL